MSCLYVGLELLADCFLIYLVVDVITLVQAEIMLLGSIRLMQKMTVNAANHEKHSEARHILHLVQ